MELRNPDPIKILMVGALPLDLSRIKGGVEAVIINLFEGFRHLPSIRIVHVAFSKEVDEKRKVEISDNITVHYLPFRSRIELIDYSFNVQSLNDLIATEKPDLIHIQEITPQILRFLRFPLENIIVTQHGIMSEELKHASGLAQNIKGIFKAGVERFVFPRFKNILFISEYNRRLFKGDPVHEAKIFNPVNPMFFDAPRDDPGSGSSILYVGVLSRRKNIGLVLRALAMLKAKKIPFELHVAGGFKDPGYEQEVNALIVEAGLQNSVHFYGWLTQAEVRSLYRKCALFILPSNQETLPVSIAEAMAQGKVVIASDVGAIREMFSDKISGFLFERNNPSALARVLEEVINRPPDNPVGENARKEAFEKFHPSTIASATLGFYYQVYHSLENMKGMGAG